ncbi:hypothetical protein JZO70_10295 [Enterococcus sp. 669A]|uniref:Helix-turn-helix domain-containing protein n=1 Tax=Candidatus Enterococcus moelleringii TaxID=2815325 RepID=A0ABS3LAA0_9ENTE|nr:hypothetical protein [Enterococcus sp. 669A]MBO1306554.1 hypothetical protein [Enterococcus sp. 669A]
MGLKLSECNYSTVMKGVNDISEVEVTTKVAIPDEILEQIAEMVVPLVVEKLKDEMEVWTKFIDLPPCPSKSQIKKTLRIGDATLDYLIANGATPMVWGENTIRIQRSDLVKAFDNTKIKL